MKPCRTGGAPADADGAGVLLSSFPLCRHSVDLSRAVTSSLPRRISTEC